MMRTQNMIIKIPPTQPMPLRPSFLTPYYTRHIHPVVQMLRGRKPEGVIKKPLYSMVKKFLIPFRALSSISSK